MFVYRISGGSENRNDWQKRGWHQEGGLPQKVIAHSCRGTPWWDDVVAADGADGVRVEVARSFVVDRPVIVPAVVEEGDDGIGFD
ncbi:predicted protein [Chaetomium globosum CBS 148.51]|uniref:Uncharacterized protein n=1 Tax=Chaetomium globosum (strain ATCC 6205 / CBS 148.51 / DSM 1962 / NBRC 6347 / NRRL 1970) TaxID=306901 RepID=Q2H883_CHAGB|nr:uncharacterized protein CHGG_03571 [Chaetomium globosum CBS 148.51]EAQ91636.1 predicted protein [Chaetomium globosum CBS 148.51]